MLPTQLLNQTLQRNSTFLHKQNSQADFTFMMRKKSPRTTKFTEVEPTLHTALLKKHS